ncbi:MAG TPA: hypothetical protein PKK94_28945, partial [Leptospiraceae bacterium]|nr:hypothetical protein [Leptospiraceae bacterium]
LQYGNSEFLLWENRMNLIFLAIAFGFLSDYGRPEYTVYFDKSKADANEKILERSGKYNRIGIDPFSAESVSCFEQKTRVVKMIAVRWTMNDKVKCQNGWN